MKQVNLMIIITFIESPLASHRSETENKVTQEGFINYLLVLRCVMELGKFSQVTEFATTVQCEQFNQLK